MSDVSKVGRDKGPEPQGPKRKKKHDSEAFKEMMKVGKVRETDPEEKRKRKRQAEVEEEMKAQQAAQPPQQGLPPQEPSVFQPKVAGGKEPGVEAAGSTTPSAPPRSAPPGSAPPSAPPGMGEPEQGAPVQQPNQPEQQGQGQQEQQTQQPQQPTQPKQKETEQQKETKAKEKKETEHAKEALTPPIKKEEGGMVAFTPTPLEKEKKPEKKEKEKKPEEPITAQPLPPGAWESIKETSKKEEPESETAITEPAPITPLAPETQAAAPPPAGPIGSPFAQLPAAVAQLFDRMVGVMTVMHETGIKETTITLNNPQFTKSPFFGSQIVITEFSTAPKEFNIQLLGNQQAVTTFQDNQQELVAAFQGGNYNFKVNRLETGYLTPPEKVKRKETKRVTRKKKGDM